MKRILYFLPICLSLFLSCSVAKKAAFDPAKKYSPSQLKEDLSLLHAILVKIHPSLYWYSTKDSIDGLFALTNSSLDDSLTQQDFRNKLSWIVDKIHCGHTMVRPSKSYYEYYRKQKRSQFPLFLKVWDDSAVVVNNLSLRDSAIKRGTIITTINGRPIKALIDSLSEFISTDGYSNTFKYQALSFNFPAYYKNTFGVDSQYTVKYIDSTGQEHTTQIRNYNSRADTLIDKKQDFLHVFITKKQLRKLKLLGNRSLTIDSSINAAMLSVNTFSEGRLTRFFKKSFREIKKKHVQNVVVDLRLNTGGNIMDCIRLSKYLVDKPFRVADTVAAINRSFPDKKYIQPWFIYWLSMHLSGRKNADNRYHFRYFEKHLFKPKKKNHFDGNIYVLTGGYTFSAATLVANTLKGQNNVKLVGEETGGGAYGNSAMHITSIVLPNTGIRVTLPLYRMVLNASHPKDGRGVLPDIEVKPSSDFIRRELDPKMEKIKKLIRGRSVSRS